MYIRRAHPERDKKKDDGKILAGKPMAAIFSLVVTRHLPPPPRWTGERPADRSDWTPCATTPINNRDPRDVM